MTFIMNNKPQDDDNNDMCELIPHEFDNDAGELICVLRPEDFEDDEFPHLERDED